MLNSIVTFIVGLFAFLVYFLSKRSEKQNAATIVVMDIRHAEQVVLSILEKGLVDKSLKNIISENNWAKYKHLFASDFSYDDFAAFNRFFDACVEISYARNRMLEVFYANLISKASISQQKIFDIEDLGSPEGQIKKQKIISEFNNEVFVFDPDDPKVRIYQSLQLMGRLSNTVAFEKLKILAGIKS
ncbi:hypothetical protein C2U68_19600 [Methylomonas koyamae]|nr:hypothetical protein C2U68_19600 [Methylomonas koyamae]